MDKTRRRESGIEREVSQAKDTEILKLRFFILLCSEISSSKFEAHGCLFGIPMSSVNMAYEKV